MKPLYEQDCIARERAYTHGWRAAMCGLPKVFDPKGFAAIGWEDAERVKRARRRAGVGPALSGGLVCDDLPELPPLK